jgi:hypothetical protein
LLSGTGWKLKGVIMGLGLSVEEEQLKWKFPGVCDASLLVSSRSSVELRETREYCVMWTSAIMY